MKKLVLTFLSVVIGLVFTWSQLPSPDTLIISECYVGLNPGQPVVEITNMGKAPVDMGKYFIASGTNGGDVGTGVSGSLKLYGTLLPGESYVVLGNYKAPITSTPDLFDSTDNTPEYYRSFDYDVMVPNFYYATKPGYNALRSFEGDDVLAICFDADGDGVWNQSLGDLVVDQVGLLAADGGARYVYPDVAGVTDATINHMLIRKFSVKLPNYGDFKGGLGVSAEDSEWIVVPFMAMNTGSFFTTMKKHGNTYSWEVNSSTVTIGENTITVPWGVRRDSLYQQFNFGTNMAWHLRWGPDTLESVITQSADTFYMYLAGDAATVKKYAVIQTPPSNDMNLVFPKFDRNDENELFLRYVVSDDFELDTIYEIPFGTRVDTLLKYLEKAPAATWEIDFFDDVERADLKTGDKLVVTAANNSKKEYYLLLDDFLPSSNANLGAIYIYGDTLYGFKPNQYDYIEYLAPDTEFPALSATPENLNAKVRIERPKSIKGSREDRTAKIYVTAVNDTIESVYTVTFEIMKMNESFMADPFFSQIMNGSGWGKGFEIFNPGNTPLPLSDYVIINSNALTLNAALSATTNIQYKMRPGYTIDSTRMGVGIYFNERPYPFITDLDPGKTLVFGRGNPPSYTGNPFWRLCDYMDTNGNLAEASLRYGFVDGCRIGFFGEGYSFMLARIDNDSIFNGLKPAGDAADYTLVDIFGAQGVNNNRTIEGTFISANSNIMLERKREVWKGNPENHGSFGTAEPGSSEWDKIDGFLLIGTHPYDPYTGYISTVYSLVYKVSLDYGPGQTIGLVPPSTTVDAFLSNIFANGADAQFAVTNAEGSVTKTGTDEVAEGDLLTVTSGTGINTTVYAISIQTPSNNATLTSTSYTVTVDGENGQVSGIPALTTIEDLLSGVTVPTGAMLTVVDAKNQQVGVEKILFDTLVSVKTMVSDSVMLEVVAEDGITRVMYKLVVTTGDPYVTSDFFLVSQEYHIIDMFQSNLLVGTFLSRLVPSTGATMTVVDKLGNVREESGIMYRDDKLLVSDGTNATTYRLRDMYHEYSTDATLANLTIDGVALQGFDPAVLAYVVDVDGNVTIPPVPVVAAEANFEGATVTVIQAENLEGDEAQRTATVEVLAEDGMAMTSYKVVFNLITGVEKSVSEILDIYAEGKTICIKTSSLGNDDKVEVFNISGQRVVSREIRTTFERIQITDPSGLYIVKVKSGNNTRIEKLILR